MKAILHNPDGGVSLTEVVLRDPGPGELLVAVSYSCIGPGTELRCLAGRAPGMPAGPYVPGYQQVGHVLKAGPDTRLPPGTCVQACGTRDAGGLRIQWGGHISHAVLPESSVVPVPEGVDLVEASLVKLAAIAYHGLCLARPQPHETVAVIGLGTLGQMAARLYALTGARVVAADLAPERVAVAAAAGIASVSSAPGFADLRAALGGGADVIVDVTGAPSVLSEALALARPLPWTDAPITGARYVIQGSTAGSVALPYHDAFMQEVSFLVPRDCQIQDRRAILDLLVRGRLKLRDLIGRIAPPEKAPEVYAAVADPRSGLLTAAFDWRQST